MRRIRAWFVRIRGVFNAGREEAEFVEELATHLASHIDDNLRAGMTPEDARRAALVKLGGVQQTQEHQRDRRSVRLVETLLQDTRYALRAMRNAPAFTMVALLTLALGIGATTAIFSIVDTVIFQPLAYQEAEHLFVVHEVMPAVRAPLIPVNALHFREWRQTTRSFQQLSLLGILTLNLTNTGEPERLQAARVSSNFFATLGIQPRVGRTFLDEEDQPGRDRVVIISDALWRRRFNADPQVVGRSIALDDETYEVIGVLPEGFRFPRVKELYAIAVAAEEPQLWKPFAANALELAPFGPFNFVCIGRLRSDVSPTQALEELDGIQATFARQAPSKIELRAVLVPLQDQITGHVRRGLQLMLIAVCLVLLTGCVNITNLLLMRSTGRRREIAIRTAIGASRGRLIRQLLVETVTLCGVGGALGVAVAYGAIRLILRYAPPDLPRLDEVHVNARLRVFAFALSMVTSVIVGLVPAWRTAITNPSEFIAATLRATSSAPRSGRLRSLLVGVEVALSALCLMVGGLLLHSFVKLLHVNPGFDVEHIVTVQLNVPNRRYPDPNKRAAFGRAAIERLQSLPGVFSAGVSNNLPLTGTVENGVIAIEGTTTPRMERPLVDQRIVSPDYFRTIGIPLLAGRLFDETDDGRRVAVVSSIAADRLWPGVSPVGKRFRIGRDDAPLIEVVGVAGAVRTVGLDQSPPLSVYLPSWFAFLTHDLSIAIRTTSNSLVTPGVLRNTIHQVDAELAISAVRTMEEVVAASVAQRRFQMNLVLLFATLATLLAGLGIYGVLGHAVAQRTAEFGIRLALGARSSQIRSLVFHQGLRPVAIGLGVGLVGSMGLGHLLGNLLFGVTATDPLTITGAAALLAIVALGACFVPARRAARIDPMVALRAE